MAPMPIMHAAIMLLAFGVFAAAWFCQPNRDAIAGMAWWQRLAVPLALFLGLTYAAKLPFVLTGVGWLSDGKSLVTGLTGGYLAVETVRLAFRLPRAARDLLALPLALALMLARWGCFCDGCCRGTETSLPWGVDFGDGICRHPTQIYEMLFFGLMAGLLLRLSCRRTFSGYRLHLCLIAYCVFRFALETIRLEPSSLWGLTFSQWGAALLGAVLAIQAQGERWEYARPAVTACPRPCRAGPIRALLRNRR